MGQAFSPFPLDSTFFSSLLDAWRCRVSAQLEERESFRGAYPVDGSDFWTLPITGTLWR